MKLYLKLIILILLCLTLTTTIYADSDLSDDELNNLVEFMSLLMENDATVAGVLYNSLFGDAIYMQSLLSLIADPSDMFDSNLDEKYQNKQLVENQAMVAWMLDYVAYSKLSPEDRINMIPSSSTYKEKLSESFTDRYSADKNEQYQQIYRATIEDMDKNYAESKNYIELAREEQLLKLKSERLSGYYSRVTFMFYLVFKIIIELVVLSFYLFEMMLILFLMFDLFPTILIKIRNSIIRCYYDIKN